MVHLSIEREGANVEAKNAGSAKGERRGYAADTPPARLFKYFPLDPLIEPPGLERLAGALLENRIWCGSSLAFNDPYDCLPSMGPISGQEKQALAKRFVHRHHAGESRVDRRLKEKSVLDALRELKIDDPLPPWRETMAAMGVLSLSAKPDDMLMWGHYAASHTGVCLSFASNCEPFLRAHRVHYSEDRPIFRPLGKNRVEEFVERILVTKADFWSYEEEWRVITPNKVGNLYYEPEALTGIILGSRVAPEVEEEVRLIIDRRQTPLEVSRAHLHPSEFRLVIKAEAFASAAERGSTPMV